MRNSAKIDVIAGGKSSSETYSLQVHTFEVELFSKLEHVNSQKVFKFTFNNRRRVIKVNSLADIDIDMESCPKILIEGKKRR
jgi:hypothetical protein